jgi:hypothetical protein
MSPAKLTEASVDIETLATSNDACVIAVGVAFFNADGVIAKYDFPIIPGDWHGTIDNYTVAWWMQQSGEARGATFNGGHTADYVGVHLSQLFRDYAPKTVWANDPDFDLTILREWWARLYPMDEATKILGPEFPCTFRQHRSYRTIKDLASRAGFVYSPSIEGGFTRHKAGDDAARQALYIIAATEFLTRSRNS